MHNKKMRYGLWASSAIFLAGAMTSCKPADTKVSSDVPSAIAANATVQQPADEATVDHAATDYQISGTQFDDLKRLAAPEVVFVFGSDRKTLRDLSTTADRIVDEHWKTALKRFYDIEFSGPPGSASEQVQRDQAWGNICNETQQQLMATQIDSPRGRRSVSYTEAAQTVGLINRLALDVIQKARNKGAIKVRFAPRRSKFNIPAVKGANVI